MDALVPPVVDDDEVEAAEEGLPNAGWTGAGATDPNTIAVAVAVAFVPLSLLSAIGR